MKQSLADRELELNHYLIEHNAYRICHYDEFNYKILRKINTTYKRSGGHEYRSNEAVIMADTETSKTAGHTEAYANYLVAWTISIRAAGENIVTLYGSEPRTCIETMERIHNSMRGNRTYIFFHNMAYDWVFLRQFFFERFGYPEHQLNTKPHYPISIEFNNGIILRDSLILAQRSLEKWAYDLGVYDQKAVGKWEYGKVRSQGSDFSDGEKEYIEHDTLAGVECIEAFKRTLGKNIATLPYTATGIVRESFRKVARRNRGRQWFLSQYLDFQYVQLSEAVYHGGFTHQNRFWKSEKIDALVTDGQPVICYDIASSYPFALISRKYPAGKFTEYSDCKPETILNACDSWAFMFLAEFYDVRLKDGKFPMPFLQSSKAIDMINAVIDNGRIVQAAYVKIPICDADLQILASQYTWNEEFTICRNVIFCHKDYLPRWFTDFVYQLFHDKTMLKGGDPVLYALAKAKLNSCYGMCCQHVMQNDISEDYDTGEYSTTITQDEESYQKYIDNRNTFLPYQIGIYCTAYATQNLFDLGACLDDPDYWIYSDTDSAFAWGWNEEKIKAYNERRIKLMHDRGYEGIEHNGRLYHLGIVEKDKICEEFKGIHSKCYCYRDAGTHELKITVAGVPKSGAKCLHDDIDNFKVGFVFPGTDTGKLMHTYIYEDMHEENGNLYADSIDLSPCDYLINDFNTVNWDELITEYVEVEDYEQ